MHSATRLSTVAGGDRVGSGHLSQRDGRPDHDLAGDCGDKSTSATRDLAVCPTALTSRHRRDGCQHAAQLPQPVTSGFCYRAPFNVAAGHTHLKYTHAPPPTAKAFYQLLRQSIINNLSAIQNV